MERREVGGRRYLAEMKGREREGRRELMERQAASGGLEGENNSNGMGNNSNGWAGGKDIDISGNHVFSETGS